MTAWKEVRDYSKMKKGDKIQYRGRVGTLLTNACYIVHPLSGLFYADILWDDGSKSKDFMLCLIGLKWKPKR